MNDLIAVLVGAIALAVAAFTTGVTYGEQSYKRYLREQEYERRILDRL